MEGIPDCREFCFVHSGMFKLKAQRLIPIQNLNKISIHISEDDP